METGPVAFDSYVVKFYDDVINPYTHVTTSLSSQNKTKQNKKGKQKISLPSKEDRQESSCILYILRVSIDL